MVDERDVQWLLGLDLNARLMVNWCVLKRLIINDEIHDSENKNVLNEEAKRGKSSYKERKSNNNMRRTRSKSNRFTNMEYYLSQKKWYMKKTCWNLKNEKQGKQAKGIINVDGLYSLHGGGRLNLSCDSLIVARGNISSYFYWMQVKVSKDVVYAVENDGSMELWLKRLGHMSDKGIFLLSKKEGLGSIVMLSLETNFMSVEDKMVKDVDKSENPTQGYERLRVQSFDTGPQSGRG
uniref:GAG-pre-integrase domain-containing protein n=1 Tax=Brassica oleracea var. oleracea TaxID=109376 RepID=A0A0D3BDR3_BRAOL